MQYSFQSFYFKVIEAKLVLQPFNKNYDSLNIFFVQIITQLIEYVPWIVLVSSIASTWAA